jgi:hypothetical protein
MRTLRHLPANAVSAVLGAAAFGILSAGTAVAVTTSNVSLTDASSGTRAHVTGNNALVTAERDPYSGDYGRVVNGGQVVNSRDAIPSVTLALSAGTSGQSTARDTYAETAAVPSSGRSEVQTVSIMIKVNQGQRPDVELLYHANGSWQYQYLPVQYQATDSTGGTAYDTFVGMLDVHLYLDPGTKLGVQVDRHAFSGDFYSWNLSASGHSG